MKIRLDDKLVQMALAFVGALCIIEGMKPHKQIIRDAESADTVATLCGVSIHTVRSWVLRNRIPSEYWLRFSSAGLTTLEELAAHVDGSESRPDIYPPVSAEVAA